MADGPEIYLYSIDFWYLTRSSKFGRVRILLLWHLVWPLGRIVSWSQHGYSICKAITISAFWWALWQHGEKINNNNNAYCGTIKDYYRCCLENITTICIRARVRAHTSLSLVHCRFGSSKIEIFDYFFFLASFGRSCVVVEYDFNVRSNSFYANKIWIHFSSFEVKCAYTIKL